MNSNKTNIHHTAIVHEAAKLGDGVTVGAYCVIGKDVCIGDNTHLHSHVVIDNVACKIGKNNELYPFVSINKPQDLKFKGEQSRVIIGNNNIIREYATIQPGTAGDKMETIIGDNCLLMACTHVAHDCVVGNSVQMANHATLAGHVNIGNYAIIGGLSAIHQFVTIGDYAIIGGMSGVEHDVIPYGHVKGERASLTGLNIIGLKRQGFTRKQIDTLREIYDSLFHNGDTLQNNIARIKEQHANDSYVELLINFITRTNRRSLLTPK